jgi:ABC-type phosphate transport system permease subunit
MSKPSQKPGTSLRAKFGERTIETFIVLCGWSSIISIIAILYFLFREAAPIVPKIDWREFFTSTRWIPAPAKGNPAHYGALGLIVGTLATTLIGMLVAIPAGLGAAIYVAEFAGKRLRDLVVVSVPIVSPVGIVTHSMAQARRVSDDCIYMLLGELVEHRPTAGLFSFPRDSRTAMYVEGRYG